MICTDKNSEACVVTADLAMEGRSRRDPVDRSKTDARYRNTTPSPHDSSDTGGCVRGGSHSCGSRCGCPYQRGPGAVPGRDLESVPVTADIAARSPHAICELARLANCGECWAPPHVPCLRGELGTAAYHVARFARARRKGLISDLDLFAASAEAEVFANSTVVYDETRSA